jgi:hypothetical protein
VSKTRYDKDYLFTQRVELLGGSWSGAVVFLLFLGDHVHEFDAAAQMRALRHHRRMDAEDALFPRFDEHLRFDNQTIQRVGTLLGACEQFLDACHQNRAHRKADITVADLNEYVLIGEDQLAVYPYCTEFSMSRSSHAPGLLEVGARAKDIFCGFLYLGLQLFANSTVPDGR